MTSPLKAAGATFRPELAMKEADWQVIDDLLDACQAHEKRDTFYPFFQHCGECRGFIFGESKSIAVRRQLGCCGCVIAFEMEMRQAAGIKAPPMQRALAAAKVGGHMSLLDRLLALDARGSTAREELRYLHRARHLGAVRATHGPKTRMMMTRHRLHKDKAPRAQQSAR